MGGLFHDKEYTLTENRPVDGYVTADAIIYQIKSVMASSVAENPTDTVASGSAVTVKPVSGSAVSGETGISYTSEVAMKQKDGILLIIPMTRSLWWMSRRISSF